ncbi:ABC transporter permease [Vallitalea longa]|uniref:ABC transporter permease n=1 Tax=Vallitalea longa TaxID=2936439 RepID=A0A9W5YC09_9FIRM|nr:carbohydrate ABC transporter permease [Vallitalea longa]GKX29741.1 ABC transporter permease [Vallitalea longa]
MRKNKKNKPDILKFNKIKKSSNVIFNIIFIIASIISIAPIIYVLMISLTSEKALARYGYHLIPREFSLDAYIFLYQEADVILKALLISIIVTCVGTIVGVILTSTMGYVLSRPNYKLKGFLSWIVFIPMIFNGGMIATYVVYTNFLGLKDTIWSLILPLAVSSFNVIICKTFFKTTIPESIIESARIDGASQLNIFIKIVLPISKPVLATISLFLSFGYWNDWFLSSLYINDSNLLSLQALLNNIQKNIEYLANNPTAGVSLQQYKNQMPKEGVRMAIAIIIALPIACIYPFFQKYFISGLTIGAVKG